MMLSALTTGGSATLTGALWAELFGTRHLGAIKALATAVMVFGTALGPGLTGLVIDAGIDFPAQMTAIGVYFLGAGALAAVALQRAIPRLAPAPKVDVVRA
jgi:MFS family permease